MHPLDMQMLESQNGLRDIINYIWIHTFLWVVMHFQVLDKNLVFDVNLPLDAKFNFKFIKYFCSGDA